MSADVLDQIMEELKKVTLPFGLQLDESTDEAQCSQLMAFVRYTTETCMKEEFLFCELLLATTKAAYVYQLIDEFFSKNGLDWKTKLGFISTVGAPSMLGKKSGFGAGGGPTGGGHSLFSTSTCIAFKNSFSRLKSAMDTAVQAVNFIWSRALNHRLFKIFFQEVGAAHEVLLYHTEVRWLSHGRVCYGT
jgi:hypothetical protein